MFSLSFDTWSLFPRFPHAFSPRYCRRVITAQGGPVATVWNGLSYPLALVVKKATINVCNFRWMSNACKVCAYAGQVVAWQKNKEPLRRRARSSTARSFLSLALLHPISGDGVLVGSTRMRRM